VSPDVWLGGWAPLVRTVTVGAAAYVVLVLLVRASGKRTLAKMNAFDLIVTVALGSTLATVVVSKEVAFAQGVLAFAVLVGLQLVITWLSVRSRRVQSLVKAEPQLLLRRGELLPDAMRRERVTAEELEAVVRSEGVGQMEEVEAVVLETDGSFSVIRRASGSPLSSLRNVRGCVPE
jgi:uncharacterized membrane protein YcaP (DUF421 family)